MMKDMAKKAVEEQVVEQLKGCFDPEIPVNIYDLGLIYDIQVEASGCVAIKMTLTAPNCPAAQSLPVQVKEAAEKVEAVKSAHVEVVFDPPWTTEKMSESAKLAVNIL